MKSWTVYGLFAEDGLCRYVGQTRCQTTRSRAHWRKHGDSIAFRVLQVVLSAGKAAQMETKWIRKYRRAGHPLANKRRGSRVVRHYDLTKSAPGIQRVDTGELFISTAHVAAHYGQRSATVRNRFKNHLLPDRTAWVSFIGGKTVLFRVLEPRWIP